MGEHNSTGELRRSALAEIRKVCAVYRGLQRRQQHVDQI